MNLNIVSPHLSWSHFLKDLGIANVRVPIIVIFLDPAIYVSSCLYGLLPVFSAVSLGVYFHLLNGVTLTSWEQSFGGGVKWRKPNFGLRPEFDTQMGHLFAKLQFLHLKIV